MLELASRPSPTYSFWPDDTVNDTDPLVSCCWLTPPASGQSPQPLVFWSAPPVATDLTRDVQTTAVVVPAKGAAGAGAAVAFVSARMVVSFLPAPGDAVAYFVVDRTI